MLMTYNDCVYFGVMTATPVSKDQVRLMVADLGYDETAKRLNIKPATIRQWAHRGKWSTPIRTDERVTLVTRPVAQVHADVLAEHEQETRLSLAKSARRMAKDAEQCTLRDSDKVLKVGQLAGIVHKWNDGQKGESFSLNVLNMGALEVRVGKEIADSDQTISE